MTRAVSIKKLSFAYARDKAEVISDISLDLEKGSVTAVLGANGVGKTTLLYLLLGLYKACAGEILFFGRSRDLYTEKQIRRCIGMVSQNESVPFDLSVEEYVLLGRAPHLKLLQVPGQEDRKAAFEALATVGMEAISQRIMTRLSSGQRQLASVARALAQAPEILMLDEPCSHLDLINSRRMLKFLKSIAHGGRTIVFTTHDPNAAAAVADQVVMMKQGKVVAKGAPEKVLTGDILTQTYGDTVEVVQTVKGPRVLTI